VESSRLDSGRGSNDSGNCSENCGSGIFTGVSPIAKSDRVKWTEEYENAIWVSKWCHKATTMPVNSRKRFLLIYGTLNGVYNALNPHLRLATALYCRFIPAPAYTSFSQFRSSTQTTVVLFDDTGAFEIQMRCGCTKLNQGARKLRLNAGFVNNEILGIATIGGAADSNW
jgi:hypothetical protein